MPRSKETLLAGYTLNVPPACWITSLYSAFYSARPSVKKQINSEYIVTYGLHILPLKKKRLECALHHQLLQILYKFYSCPTVVIRTMMKLFFFMVQFFTISWTLKTYATTLHMFKMSLGILRGTKEIGAELGSLAQCFHSFLSGS